MKFQIEKVNFEEQLNIVSRAINNKTTLPVLSNVLLKVENNTLFLTTTNLEIAIETSTPVMNSEDGSTTTPVKLLLNYINLLPGGLINIETKDKETLHISSENSNTNIKCIASTEFPIIPKSPEEISFEINIKDIQKAFTQTVFAAALDGRRPVLSGVYLQIKDKVLTVAATDSYRLAEKKIDVSVDNNISVIIPSHTILELVRILTKGEGGDMVIKVSKNQIIFNIGSIFLTSRLIEGTYPEYQKIIPTTVTTEATVDIEALTTILKRVNLFAREVSNGIKLQFTTNGIEVISDNSQIGTEESMYKCDVEGKDQLVSFNAEYLIEGLNNIDGDTAKIGINDPLTPGILKNTKDTSYIHIVMPLKI